MNEIKGIVLEIKGAKAHILTSSGDFIVCDTNQIHAQIGDEVTLKQKVEGVVEFRESAGHKRLYSFQKFAIAAVFLMAVVGGTWFYPTDWIYLEINPSIAMKINMYDRVIGYEGLNQDGAKVASGISVYGNTVEKVIDTSMKEIAKDGFMTAEKKNAVIIGYGSEKAKAKASKQIEKFVKSSKLPTTVASIPLQSETIDVAKNEAVSPINLEIVKKNKKLKKSDWVKEVKRMEKLKTWEIIQNHAADQTVDVNLPTPPVNLQTSPEVTVPVTNTNQPTVPDVNVPSANSNQEGVAKERLDKAVSSDATDVQEKPTQNEKGKKPRKTDKLRKLYKLEKLDKPDKPEKPDKPQKPDKPNKLDKPEKAPVSTQEQQDSQNQQDQPIKEPVYENDESIKATSEVQDSSSDSNLKRDGKIEDRIVFIQEKLDQLEASITEIENSDLTKSEKKQKLTSLHQRVKLLKLELKALKNHKN